MRIETLAAANGVTVDWHPFLLGPIFQAQGWDTSPFNLFPAKGRYMWQDLARQAQRQGLPPITRPDPFPQNGLLAARIATIGVTEGWVAPFTRAVFDAQFARSATISNPETLRQILADLVSAPDATIARAKQDQTVKEALRKQTATAQSLGIFGAPSFVTPDGNLFWGDDRLEAALEHMLQD